VVTPALSQQVLKNAQFMLASNAPGFIVKTISESTDIADQDNIMTVKLRTNFLVRDGSTVTVSALMGSQSADNTTFAVIISGEIGEFRFQRFSFCAVILFGSNTVSS